MAVRQRFSRHFWQAAGELQNSLQGLQLCERLFQPPDQPKAPPTAAYARSVAKPSDRSWQSNTIALDFENVGKALFFCFPPSKRGGLGNSHSGATSRLGVSPHCTSLQKFANRAKADRLRNPAARVARGILCTRFEFAQKKDTKPVGGRGISDFSNRFFF